MDESTGLPVVGVVGAGPPTRMVQQAALGLGVTLRVFGRDRRSLDELRNFAQGCDAITCLDGRVPIEHVAVLEADGVAVHPGADALRSAQRVPVDERAGARVLAVVVARSPFGQGAVWPVTELVAEVVAPAPDLEAEAAGAAQRLALRTAREIGATGVLAVEMHATADGFAVRRVAVGPHPAANWTIEGARTSQYEQHLRAVLDYPLGTTAPAAPVVVTAGVAWRPGVPPGIDERVHHAMAHWPDVKIHMYGTDPPSGHVTALGEDLGVVRGSARAAADYLTKGKT